MDANILKYLRSNGEQLDADISKALNVPMARLRLRSLPNRAS